MSRDLIIYITDIIESIEKIEGYKKGLSKTEFYKNEQIQDAIMRRLEIIGEATKNIPDDFRKKYPKVEWKKIAGLRDILIHTYFSINLKLIWKVLKNEIKKVKKELLKIKKDLVNME